VWVLSFKADKAYWAFWVACLRMDYRVLEERIVEEVAARGWRMIGIRLGVLAGEMVTTTKTKMTRGMIGGADSTDGEGEMTINDMVMVSAF
jgi:hypothetical protein